MSQIKRLVIKDCLGIEELAINPGRVNVISGGNERGKTTILESIEKALRNSKRRARFVRDGADAAFIELETDDGVKISRTVEEDEAGLDVGSVKVVKDGVAVKAPETFLKKLVGITDSKRGGDGFSFNPIDFMQKKDAEQADILLKMIPIKVTQDMAWEWFGQTPKVNYEKHGLQVLKDLEQWFYDARREANTRVKATEDEVAAVKKRIPDNYDAAKWEAVNLASMYNALRDIEQKNAELERCREFADGVPGMRQAIRDRAELRRSEARRDAEDARAAIRGDMDIKKGAILAEIREVTERMAELEKRLVALQTEAKNLETMDLTGKIAAVDAALQARFDAIGDVERGEIAELERKIKEVADLLAAGQVVDIAPIASACEHAEKMKAFLPLASGLTRLLGELDQRTALAQELDRCLMVAREKPAELVKAVSLPVQGLGISDSGAVTIDGLPLSNMSTSRQIRVCLDIAREIARDNVLKFICVDRMESLDEDVRAEFMAQIEADEEFQYFVTEATRGDLQIESR